MTDGTESTASTIRSPSKEPEVTITPPPICANPDCLFDHISLFCEQQGSSRKKEIEDFLYRNGNSSGQRKDTLDSRKLHLLRSFSQDSDSSLNKYDFESTTFDAEEFLEDLGFAGPEDPTIPDRFMPSLIRRISSLPDMAKKNLDQRVWQSIGCFKRKEGKNRLFRNRSFDREEYSCCSSPGSVAGDSFRSPTCGLSSHGHRRNDESPLMRSQTGPAAFSDEKEKYSGAVSGFELKNIDKSTEVSSSKIPKEENAFLTSDETATPNDVDVTEQCEALSEKSAPELILSVLDNSDRSDRDNTPQLSKVTESIGTCQATNIIQVSCVKVDSEIPFTFHSETGIFSVAAVPLEVVCEADGFNDSLGHMTDDNCRHDEIKTNTEEETKAQMKKLDFERYPEENESDTTSLCTEADDSKQGNEATSSDDASSEKTGRETNEVLKVCHSDYTGQQKKQSFGKLFTSVTKSQFLQETLCPPSCSSPLRNDEQEIEAKYSDCSNSLAFSSTGMDNKDYEVNTNCGNVSERKLPQKKNATQRKFPASAVQPALLEKMRHHSTGSLPVLIHNNTTQEKDKVTVFNPSVERSFKSQKNVLPRKKSVATSPLPRAPFLSPDFESYSSSGKILKLLERINSELKSECGHFQSSDMSSEQTSLDRKRSASASYLASPEETKEDPITLSVIKPHIEYESPEETKEDPNPLSVIKTHIEYESPEETKEDPNSVIKTHTEHESPEETKEDPNPLSVIKTHIEYESSEETKEDPNPLSVIKTHIEYESSEETKEDPNPLSVIKTHIEYESSEETKEDPNPLSMIKTHTEHESPEKTKEDPNLLSVIKTHTEHESPEKTKEDPNSVIKTHTEHESPEETKEDPNSVIKTHTEHESPEETKEDPESLSVIKTRTENEERSEVCDFQKLKPNPMRRKFFRKQSTVNQSFEVSDSPPSNADSNSSLSPLAMNNELNEVAAEQKMSHANSHSLDPQRMPSCKDKSPLLSFSPLKIADHRIKDCSESSLNSNDSHTTDETPKKSILFLHKANVSLLSSPKLEAKFRSSKNESPRLFTRGIRSISDSDAELSPILRRLPATPLTSDSSYSSPDFSPSWKRKSPNAKSKFFNSADSPGNDKSKNETASSGFKFYSVLNGNSQKSPNADDSKPESSSDDIVSIPTIPRRGITPKMCECGRQGTNFSPDDSDSNIKVQLHSPKQNANGTEADEILCVVMPDRTLKSKSFAEEELSDLVSAATSNGSPRGENVASLVKETESQTSGVNTSRVSDRFKIISHPFRRLNTKLKTEDLFMKKTDKTPTELKYYNKSLSLGNIDVPLMSFRGENEEARGSPRSSSLNKREQPLLKDKNQHFGPKVNDLLEKFESFRSKEANDLSERNASSLKRKQHLLDKSPSVKTLQWGRKSSPQLLPVRAPDNNFEAGKWIESIKSSDRLSPMPNRSDAHNNYDNDKERDFVIENIVQGRDTLQSPDDNGHLLHRRSVSHSNSEMLSLTPSWTHAKDHLQKPASIKEILRTTEFGEEAAEIKLRKCDSLRRVENESPTNSSGNRSETFVNGVYLVVNCDDCENELGLNPDLHYSSVYLEINGDQEVSAEADCGIREEPEGERSFQDSKLQRKENVCSSPTDCTSESESMRRKRTVLQNPSQRASRDLEELQEAIQKVKETRVSASRELFLLQELLRKGSDDTGSHLTSSSQDSSNGIFSQDTINRFYTEEENECPTNSMQNLGHQVETAAQGLNELYKEENCDIEKEGLSSNSDAICGLNSETESNKRPLPQSEKSLNGRESLEKELAALREEMKRSGKREIDATEKVEVLKSALMDLQAEKSRIQEALSDLQQKTKKETSSESQLNEEEICRIKEQVRQEWRQRFSEIKQKLNKREIELDAVKEENTKLKEQVELSRIEEVSCQCRSKVKNHNFTHINGISLENGTTVQPGVKSSSPIRSIRQDCDRLQKSLMEAEQRADHLNLLLNQKLIELNKLQLTLSKQTKDMIQLEKAYFQLRCHLTKGSNKSLGPRLSPSSRISPLPQISSYDRLLSPLSLVKQDSPP